MNSALWLAPFLEFGFMQREQVVDGALVDRGEGLVEQHHRGVLQDQAREQGALQLAARERVDAAPLEAQQADRGQRLVAGAAVRGAVAPERAYLVPQAEHRQLLHRDREAAVDAAVLRQAGHALARAQAIDVPAQGRELAGQRL